MTATPDRAGTDVVVVGGGPVGMTLATELAQYGTAVTVLETRTETADEPKAGTLHARTIQSLLRRGVLRLGPRTAQTHGTVHDRFHFAGRWDLPISAPASEGAPIVGLPQGELERIQERRAQAAGARILRGHRVDDIRQDDTGVTTVASSADGTITMRSSYLVGADGARSQVRTALGFTADITAPKVAALVGLVRLLEPDRVPRGWTMTPRGWLLVGASAAGLARVITFDFSGPHPDRTMTVTPDELHDTASRIAGHDIAMADAHHLSRFSDFSRVVHDYRDRRVLLAGDAAHVHFPVGGQGLNLGVQDAFNLGWKLAGVIAGRTGPEILDTYTTERRPAARRVVDNTLAQAALMDPDPSRQPLRDLFTELMTFSQVSNHLGDMISAQEASLGEFATNMLLPLADGGTVALADLLIDGNALLLTTVGQHLLAPGKLPDPVRRVTLHHEHQLPWSTALIRPDGYLAWTAPREAPSDTPGLDEALVHWFGRAPGRSDDLAAVAARGSVGGEP